VIVFHGIEKLMPMKKLADKTRMFWTLLKAQALSYFEHHLKKRVEVEDSEFPENEFIELVIRDLGLEYIPKPAIHMKKYYKRRGLNMGLNMSVQQFVERQMLNNLNGYLLYFPEEKHKQLDQDEIIEIIDQSKPMDPEWHESMMNANIEILKYMMRDLFLISSVWRS
jgi:hypothetical protein